MTTPAITAPARAVEPAASYARRAPTLAVAPMMDWTDRHCRFFHRLLTRRTLLYTEMVVADAVIHGPRERLLGFDAAEHPVALQIGGSEPGKLAEAARIGAALGYGEINLNVGCPSDRVRSGAFGACLMREPDLVARCIAAMADAVDGPVTVKCRIGVDEQDPGPALDALADAVVEAGAAALWVHARKAWLEGLSPKENREVPPLDYGRVHALHARLDRFVGINGGLGTLGDVAGQLARTDGVMVGRAAYRTPAILAGFDALLGEAPRETDWAAVVEAMAAYADRHVAAGGRLHAVAKHMVGLFHGRPGAREWRRTLSTEAIARDATGDVLRRAHERLVAAGALAEAEAA